MIKLTFSLADLGIVKNIPKVNFVDYSGVFIAPPKFGKTTTASKFPNSVIVPFEAGTKGQVVNVAKDVKDWDTFVKFVDKLEQNRQAIGTQIQTIVFDTVNKAYEKCEKYTLKKLSIADKKKYKTMSDVAHGKAYAEKDKFFVEQIDRILALGFNILFISHLKVKTIRPKNGEAYDVYSSTMPERLEGIINPLVDFILKGEKKVIDGEEKRVLITKGNSMADAGGRVSIDEDIVFETEAEAIEKYQELFRQSIQKKLDEHGITRDLDEIAQEQMEEKLAEVKEYVETKTGETNDIDYITEKVALLSKEQGVELKKKYKEKFASTAYKKYTGEQLKEAVEILDAILAEKTE